MPLTRPGDAAGSSNLRHWLRSTYTQGEAAGSFISIKWKFFPPLLFAQVYNLRLERTPIKDEQRLKEDHLVASVRCMQEVNGR